MFSVSITQEKMALTFVSVSILTFTVLTVRLLR